MSNDDLITSASRPTIPPVPDRKVARAIAKGEQQRRDAAAAVELKAREAEVRREQRRADDELKRERRATKEAASRRRREAARSARGRLIARIRAAAPTLGRRVMIAGPILAPMAVAWIGQIQFAQGTLSWPFLGAIVFAASWELTTAFAGWMYHTARKAGDHGALFRAATWLFAASAGAMNYWHALGGNPVTNPTPKAVSYGAMSLVGIGLWELYSSLVHRTALRARGVVPLARPRFGVARWVRYPRITWWAWSLTIRCGLGTTDEAWTAGVAEVTRREQAKAARQAASAGRRLRVTWSWRKGPRLVRQNGMTQWTAVPIVWLPPVESATETAPTPAVSGAPKALPVGDSNDRQNSTANTAGSGDNTEAAKKPPTPAKRTSRSGAKKRGRNSRRSMDEWVRLTEPIFHSEFQRLRRKPTADEFATAIANAGHGRPSESTAKNIRTEILDRTPLPQLDEESTE